MSTYNWEQLFYQYEDDLAKNDFHNFEEPVELHNFLNNAMQWTDNKIWKTHIQIAEMKTASYKQELDSLEKELEAQKVKDQLGIEVLKQVSNVPYKESLDRLLRYEAAINRQLYKALNELERLQRIRAGEQIPPPLDVNVEVSSENEK